ncbi:MAG: Coenzyme F420 hydrogenase/dehydrogenase, beta subunit C-terminal domain [Candidatus Thorarchaeota archaeon]|jgi:coenzyme F420 hydrogenase subunit beta
MHDCFKDNLSSIGVVGTACNIDAIHRMQTHPGSYLTIDSKTDVFKVSLFCMESFDYDGLVGFLKNEGIDIKKVERFAITKGNFIVTIGGEEKSWPVKDLDSIATSSCSYCTDLTGMNSDLSCGNIGSEDGWTTVLVRSKRGDKVLKAVIREGLVEAEKIDEKALQAVINTARSKKNKRFKLKPPH